MADSISSHAGVDHQVKATNSTVWMPTEGSRVRIRDPSSPGGPKFGSGVGTLYLLAGAMAWVKLESGGDWMGLGSRLEEVGPDHDEHDVAATDTSSSSTMSEARSAGPASHPDPTTPRDEVDLVGSANTTSPTSAAREVDLDVEVGELGEGPALQHPPLGSRVRVRSIVQEPWFGWPSHRRHAEIGEVLYFNEDGHAIVKFETRPRWKCMAEELEIVWDVRDLGFASPAGATATSSSFGAGAPSAAEAAAVEAGAAAAAVLAALAAEAEPEEEQYVEEEEEDTEAPPEAQAEALLTSSSDMTPSMSSSSTSSLAMGPTFGTRSDDGSSPADEPLTAPAAPAIQAGSRVRIRQGVPEPAFGWNTVSAHDEGVVVSVEDALVEVNFDRNSTWMGLATELEIVAGRGTTTAVTTTAATSTTIATQTTAAPVAAPVAPRSEEEDSFPACKICCEDKVNVALIPCGHTGCSVCIDRLNRENQGFRCPWCRTPVLQLLKLFG